MVFRGRRLGSVEREAMAATGVSVDALMEAAGLAVASAVPREGGSALLLVGSGNNGGDAVVAGRYLRLAGWRVQAYLPMGVRSEALRVNLERFLAVGGEITEALPAQPPDVIIDGLLGSGGSRPLAGAAEAAVLWANGRASFRLAIDIPSGTDPDSGSLLGTAFLAHRTVVLGAWKPPHLFYPARAYVGEPRFHPLGVPLPEPDAILVEPEDVARPPWRADDQKHVRGRVALLVGSERFPGAAVLAAAGALSAGAGYVVAEVPEGCRPILLARLPEVIALSRRGEPASLRTADAVVVGPGLGRDEEARRLVAAVLEAELPAVLDADALYLLREIGLEALRPGLVLTPHQREWERLLGPEGLGAPPFPAAPLARAGAVVVQKGPTSAVLAEGTVPRVLAVGHALLAQGGSGDVLAGVVGALLALGLPPFDAAVTAVLWHGKAAELLAEAQGPVGAGAFQVARNLPRAARVLWS